MSEPLVSIITVNYNQTAVTCALLDSIRRQNYKHVEVFVVDNASDDDPKIIIESAFPEVFFLRSTENLGFAGGNNLALPHVKGDYLLFVNNDAELTATCLQTILGAFQEQPLAGMVSPLLCYYPTDTNQPDLIQYAGMTAINPFSGRNRTLAALERDHGQFDALTETAYCHGAAMMVPRKVLEIVGPMHEDYFLYYEELDWCARIKKAGWKCLVEPRAKIYHKESLTVAAMGALKTYYLTRNRRMFMRRNFPTWKYILFLLFFYTVTIPIHSLRYMKNRQWENLWAFLSAALGLKKNSRDFKKRVAAK
jgi:GT2 family glycosyltransferase